MRWLESIDASWQTVFQPFNSLISKIETELSDIPINPTHDLVLRAFKSPIDRIKVVIFGQDPYPTLGHATGLAFSVPSNTKPLPKSLQNIFHELQKDLGGELRTDGDLSDWDRQGVALINRILTLPIGVSGGHRDFGWQQLTSAVASALGERDVVAILWGNSAQELISYFNPTLTLTSPHPSPLSAHRGFFGSRPFSRANQLLESQSNPAIDWL